MAPRARSGNQTPKTRSFRFTPEDLRRLERAQRLMGLESQAEVLRVLVGRYIEEQERGRSAEEHARAAAVPLLDEQLHGRVERALRQLGPAIVRDLLVELLEQDPRRPR